jgi:hypothetical protein
MRRSQCDYQSRSELSHGEPIKILEGLYEVLIAKPATGKLLIQFIILLLFSVLPDLLFMKHRKNIREETTLQWNSCSSKPNNQIDPCRTFVCLIVTAQIPAAIYKVGNAAEIRSQHECFADWEFRIPALV